jgi:putative ABC transport system ATP-binding protein
MGASGSGKSTLLHLMAGLAKPDGGRVVVNGEDLTKLNDRDLTLFRRRQIGLVFQAFNLISTLTAEENIALPLMLEGKRPDEIKAKVEELMRRLGMLARRRHRPDAMSGGEQQRCAIGRALVTEPSVILADEPTGALDSRTSIEIMALLQKLNRQGMTIVIVTHEHDVAEFASRIIFFRDGMVLKDEPNQPQDAQAALAQMDAARAGT